MNQFHPFILFSNSNRVETEPHSTQGSAIRKGLKNLLQSQRSQTESGVFNNNTNINSLWNSNNNAGTYNSKEC